MKQFNLAFLLTILMSMVGVKALAYDAYIDGIYYNFSGTEAIVTCFSHNKNAYHGSVVIPESVTYNGNSYSVTSIGSSAFIRCTGLTSITIPNSVTNIDGAAFNGCTGLTSITIPNSVTSIGSSAFQDCSNLISITIPNSVTSIGSGAFLDCSNLISITIPNSVTSIGGSAFEGTAWYNNLPDGLVYAGKVAYKYKGTMPANTSISIKEGTLEITSYAFLNCTGLTSITIPNSVTSIGDGSTFCGCSNLTSITIPNSVTSIGSETFKGCSGLTSIIIPNSVKSIAQWAFQDCIGLTSVTIPNSVTSIGFYVFEGCNSLVTVNVPVIDYSAFCNNTIVGMITERIGKPILLVDEGGNEIKEYIIPNEVESIGANAFRGCSGLTSITIPNSVTSIGTYAFYGCCGLTSVTIPNSVTSIGDNAFDSCSGLTSVTFHCKEIGSWFSGSSSIKEVVIGNEVTSIGEMAFSNTMLNSVIIGTGVLSIGRNVFGFFNRNRPVKVFWLTNTPPTDYSNAAGTVNYVANDSYTSLSNKKVYPFLSSMFEVDGVKYVPVSPSERTCDAIDCAYNESAGNINIGKSVSYQGIAMTVKYVNEYVCYQNGFIKEINLSFEGNLGNNAFGGCTLLESAMLGENIISIGDYAFSGCSSLKSIEIPNALTSIGDYGFSDCSSMTSVKIGSSVITIGTYAFNNCSALSQIVIPQSVTKIDNYAFYGCTSLANVNMEDRNSDDTALTLGSNGSNPLFSSCPLDEVYIGRNISYSTESYSGYSPFYRNTSLKTVTITNKETEISPNEFYGCTSLKNVTIGDGVTTIGDWAFSGCSSLDYFACGSKVANIGKEAFSDCTAMTKLISRAATPPVCGAQALDDINKWNCKLQVPEASIPAYQAADQWKEFFFIEPTGINEIKEDTTRQYRYYDLNGNLLLQPHKGVNILKSSNGKTKKIMVK